MDLGHLISPRSIAVVGATDRPGSYGGQALLNLDAIGFTGRVWGVNPGRTEVLGRPCVPSVLDLPEPADAVVVAIPAAGVPAALEQAGVPVVGQSDFQALCRNNDVIPNRRGAAVRNLLFARACHGCRESTEQAMAN